MRSERRLLALSGALLLVFMAGCGVLDPIASDQKNPTQWQVESELTCQCGCGLTVHSCNHLSCSSGEPLKLEVSGQIATGKNLAEVLTHFEDKYGEVILSAPTQRGFNLVAWITPFVMIGLGGIGIALMLRGWRRGGDGDGGGSDAGEAVTTDPGLRARLEEELEKFDRRG
jgi:cytochrome c-type biogenesis protein CcmH